MKPKEKTQTENQGEPSTTVENEGKEVLKSGGYNRRYDRHEFSLCKVTESDGNVYYAICEDYCGCEITTYGTLEEAEEAFQQEDKEYNEFQDDQEWERKKAFGCDCGDCDYCEAHEDEDEDTEEPSLIACFADIQDERVRQERMLKGITHEVKKAASL
jgi:hypothetical protein